MVPPVSSFDCWTLSWPSVYWWYACTDPLLPVESALLRLLTPLVHRDIQGVLRRLSVKFLSPGLVARMSWFSWLRPWLHVKHSREIFLNFFVFELELSCPSFVCHYKVNWLGNANDTYIYREQFVWVTNLTPGNYRKCSCIVQTICTITECFANDQNYLNTLQMLYEQIQNKIHANTDWLHIYSSNCTYANISVWVTHRFGKTQRIVCVNA